MSILAQNASNAQLSSTNFTQTETDFSWLQSTALDLPPGLKRDLILSLIPTLPPDSQRHIARVLGLEIVGEERGTLTTYKKNRPENRKHDNCGWVSTDRNRDGSERPVYRWNDRSEGQVKKRKRALRSAQEVRLISYLISRRTPQDATLQALTDFQQSGREVTLDKLLECGMLTTYEVDAIISADGGAS